MESPVGRRIPSTSSRIPENKIATPRAIKADAGKILHDRSVSVSMMA